MATSNLVVLVQTFAVSRLPAETPLPRWAEGGQFVSITRTPDELSVVCEEAQVPLDVKCERGWRCLKVSGPLDFSSVGILASLVEPMARAHIPVFVISTFDTDHLLIKDVDLGRSVEALRHAGHIVDY
jgi:uncharacterized protein